MENVRYNITPCSPQEAADYISRIDESVYIPRNIVKADERSHYDRYSYVRNDSRVAVVYDTFAHVISITAPKAHADELLKLFAIDGSKTVKTSTVPAQGGGNNTAQSDPVMRIKTTATPTPEAATGSKRAKLFVDPDSIRRTETYTPITVIATSKGAEISTDEIYPPQRARKRSDNVMPLGQAPTSAQKVNAGGEVNAALTRTAPDRSAKFGMTISANNARTGAPRRATISFGDEDDYGSKRESEPRAAARPTGTGIFAEIVTAPAVQQENREDEHSPPPTKRKRGRPPKNKQIAAPQDGPPQGQTDNPQQRNQQSQNNAQFGQGKRKRGRPPKISQTQQGALVTAPGYETKPPTEPTEHVMQFSRQNMADLFSRIKKSGNLNVVPDSTTEEGVAYMVTDRSGQKVSVAFSENRVSLRILGIYGDLFKTIRSYAEKLRAKNPVVVITPQRTAPQKVDVSSLSEPMRRLYKRIPTAFAFLSEQSRTDFVCGMQDFSQSNLNISDYSVLLVPPFRALERFIFDLQRAEGIQVKMIGQAYDKDDSGNYILKRGYQQRIGSVIYAEVMVALYTEYFRQRNFFAHSDNTDGKATRSLPDRASANRIFEHILDVVEYNSRKLKEIGFSIAPKI